MSTPFIKQWIGPVEEGRYMYRIHGGNFICPAILSACGPSEIQKGKFWYNISGFTQYADTLNEAKEQIEEHFKSQYP